MLAVLLGGLAPTWVHAAGSTAPLDVNHFHPAPGSGRLLGVDVADVGRSPELGAQLFLHYADLPLAYTFGHSRQGRLVHDRFTTELALSLSLFERLQLSLALPVTAHQGSEAITYTDVVTGEPRTLPRASAAGVEDLRLGLKGRLWSNERFGLGAAGEVVAPTGDADSYLGSSSLTGAVRLIGHATWERLTVGFNLGWRWTAAEQRLLNVRAGGGLLYGVGAQVEVHRHAGIPFYLLGEVTGLAHPSFADVASSPAEATLAAKAQASDWTFFLGGGAGLTSGYGTPRFRMMAGVAYTWQYRAPPPVQAPVLLAAPPPPAPQPALPPPPTVALSANSDRLELWQQVYFDFDNATIKPVSYTLLDEVARFIQSHPELGPVRIEGHTDDLGSAQYNLELSKRRARAVYEYLITHGVPAKRLSHVGYGKRCPLVSNTTEETRAVNRRVDFILVNRERRHPRPGECPERPNTERSAVSAR